MAEAHLFLVPENGTDPTDFTVQDQFQLALESAYRWSWRTDELDPMDVIRAIRKVIRVALEDV